MGNGEIMKRAAPTALAITPREQARVLEWRGLNDNAQASIDSFVRFLMHQETYRRHKKPTLRLVQASGVTA